MERFKMQNNFFGTRTDAMVTCLGFGSMSLRDRKISAAEEDTLLNTVLDLGINYVDTSIDYGNAESIIGRAISHRRDEFMLATKCGCLADSGDYVNPHIFTRENIVKGLEGSLRRLQTDYVDVLQFHADPTKSDLENEDCIGVLEDLRAEGKIKYFGTSSKVPNIEEMFDLDVFEVYQIPWSLFDDTHTEAIRKASELGAATVIRGGVAQGTPDIKFAGASFYGMSPMEMTLRYAVSNLFVSTVIVGTTDIQHLQDNVRAVEKGTLPPSVMQEISEWAKKGFE
tara:strand:+ start:10557 stop:11405 length:849 start_codon:yes stop_codon:yes gene_type:complete